ncbi:Cell number regulator 6, partial [Camellia lanceoleosa]
MWIEIWHDGHLSHLCQECGQTLPPAYQPPADEDWSTGIFGCTEDTDSWLRAACVGHIICVEGGMTFAALTSVLNGIDPHTLFLIYEGLFFAWWMCGIYTSMARQSLQKKYHLKLDWCVKLTGSNICRTELSPHIMFICLSHVWFSCIFAYL